MWKTWVKLFFVIALGGVFLFYVRDAAKKYFERDTSMTSTVKKSNQLKLPQITFCPGMKADQLKFVNGTSIGPEDIVTYFDAYETNKTTAEEISKWWNRINYAYEDIFIAVKFGQNDDLLTKHELHATNSNIALEEINSSFGRCFSFEVVTPFATGNLVKFELNMTQMDFLWFYMHDKYDKLGFYFNIWFKDIHFMKIDKGTLNDFPMTMRETTVMNTDVFPCFHSSGASQSQCLFQKAQQKFKTLGAFCHTACSIPQSQLVEDETSSNMSPCILKTDSECTKDFLKKEVIEKINPSADFCPDDCTSRTYQIKQRQDLALFNQSNISRAYFFWRTTNFAEEREYIIYDFSTIIGSVGGSLGLFLGFSCRGFVDQIIDFLDFFSKTLARILKKLHNWSWIS